MTSLSATLRGFSSPSPELIAKCNERAIEQERLEERRQLLERKNHAHVPARFKDAMLVECQVQARNWVEHFRAGNTSDLLIKGAPGSGKTYMACAILNTLVQKIECRYTSHEEILLDIKSAYTLNVSEESVISKYVVCPVLVIDDLGAPKPTEWSISTFFEIVKRRHERQRPTIYTTMYSGAKLAERLVTQGDERIAEAIISRLTDANQITLLDGDRRGR